MQQVQRADKMLTVRTNVYVEKYNYIDSVAK